MEFSFSDEQLALRDALHDLLAKECTPEVVRSALPAPSRGRPGQGIGAGARAAQGALDRLWRSLADLGLFALLVPEAAGGLGLDEVAAVVAWEELGYAAAPLPLLETMVAAAVFADGPNPPAEPAARAFERAALGTAAQLVGLARRMLDLTVPYVRERHQFGVPIGSFQAVKHHLADARLQVEFAAPAVYAAAWSLAHEEPTAVRDVSMAKAMASDAATFVARKALQCHGAIGYTVEYDLHLYLKRAVVLAATYGDAAWHRERVAAALGM